MDAVAAVVTNSSPAVKAGLEFVWLISFGQVITIMLTMGTILFGIGKIVATVWSLNREVKDLKLDVRELRSGISELMAALVTYKTREREDIEND